MSEPMSSTSAKRSKRSSLPTTCWMISFQAYLSLEAFQQAVEEVVTLIEKLPDFIDATPINISDQIFLFLDDSVCLLQLAPALKAVKGVEDVNPNARDIFESVKAAPATRSNKKPKLSDSNDNNIIDNLVMEEDTKPIVSPFNPEYNPGKNGNPSSEKNPQFETLPRPEVWHRRAPPLLPFGETPFAERVEGIKMNAMFNGTFGRSNGRISK